jgi:hypothetical protein
MTYLLDTDTCIGVLRQKPGMVQRLTQIAPVDCAVSMITVYELLCGVERAQDSGKERQKVERFISAITVLSFEHTGGSCRQNSRGIGKARHTDWSLRSADCRTSHRQQFDACDQ